MVRGGGTVPDIGIEAMLSNLEGIKGDKVQRIYPTAGTIPLITGHLNPDTYGVWLAAIAIGVVADPAWLVGIHCELDLVDIYTIQAGSGLPEVPIADFGYESQAVNTSVLLTCDPVKIGGSPPVSFRVKTVAGGNATVTDLRLIVREE